MTSRDLYTLLHLLALIDVEEGVHDDCCHLAVLILKIVAERKLTERQELG